MAEEKEKKYPWIKSIFKRKPKRNPAECVYAGPEYFRDGPVNDVYAGPEPLEPDEPDEPAESEESSEPSPIDLVYGGPEVIAPPPPQLMMCVYAGPEYFSGEQTSLGAPMQQITEKPAGKYCPFCGTPIGDGMKFCPECGTAVRSDD